MTAACSMSGSRTSMAKTGCPVTLSCRSRRRRGVPASFQSRGSFSATLAGGSILAAPSATAPKVTLRPLAVWVMTLLCAVHSEAGTFQRNAAAAISISRPVAAQILAGRHERGAHFVPVAFELFGDQHGECRHGALAHFGMRGADGHGVVGRDRHPAVDIAGVFGGAHAGAAERNHQPKRQAAPRGAGANEKRTAINFAARTHEQPPPRVVTMPDFPRASSGKISHGYDTARSWLGHSRAASQSRETSWSERTARSNSVSAPSR